MQSLRRVRKTAIWLGKLALVLGVLAALVLGGRALILRKQQALAQAPRYQAPAELVETATVLRGDLSQTHDYLAVVEPVQSANITARLTATIEEVKVDEGDRVRAGQPLILLDHRQIDAQLDAARAEILQARADLQGNLALVASLQESYDYWVREAEREQRLRERDAIPVAQLDSTLEKRADAEGKLRSARQKSSAIEQQIRSLEARRAELETTLSYCELQSPFDGVVTARLVNPGDQAAPGKTLLVVEMAGVKMIAFDIPQGDLRFVKVGLPVSYQVQGQARQASITRLYPSLNQARMVRAEMVLDEKQGAGLTSGEYLTATALLKNLQDVPLVPVTAIVEGNSDGKRRVFVVNDGVLHVREVEVLGTACDQAAVRGLEGGERVVTHSFLGWTRLAEGMKVEDR